MESTLKFSFLVLIWLGTGYIVIFGADDRKLVKTGTGRLYNFDQVGGQNSGKM